MSTATYNVFTPAKRNFYHSKYISYAFGGTFIGGGIAGTVLTKKPMFAVVGAISGAGVIGSQQLIHKYPELAFGTAISFSTFATMKMISHFNESKTLGARGAVAFAFIATCYHLSQI